MIGRKLDVQQEGIENPGEINSLEAMRQLFLQTDLVVAPGRCDPFPCFVIEAMNYGIPCIVSPQDGMPEIVDYGKSGIVVESLTANALAETMINLLTNPAALALFSQKARRKVATELNPQQVAQKMLEVLMATAY